jgi:hypothetical protein
MAGVRVSRDDFLKDHQGKALADVVNDPQKPFDAVLDFFNNEDQQRRMVESEVRYSRAPLAAVEREFESQPSIQRCLSSSDSVRRKQLGEVVTVMVRMIMDRLGWDVAPNSVAFPLVDKARPFHSVEREPAR